MEQRDRSREQTLIIPQAPQVLTLPIVTFWDGTPCAATHLHGTVTVSSAPEGVWLTGSLPHQPVPSLPAAPPLTRVANLWEYDVVECFLVGTTQYLEVELGAGGHFLLLAFTAPRCCVQAYETFVPQMTYTAEVAGSTAWRTRLLVPWSMVPSGVRGINAYVISRNAYVCYAPLPGPKADFHQPERFPSVRLAERV